MLFTLEEYQDLGEQDLVQTAVGWAGPCSSGSPPVPDSVLAGAAGSSGVTWALSAASSSTSSMRRTAVRARHSPARASVSLGSAPAPPCAR